MGMTSTQLHDMWYLTCETIIDGERRGFSRQLKAREDRHRTIPTTVQAECEAFLADVVDMSDVHDYSAVERGERLDYPYRQANYSLFKNGEAVVSHSFALRPIKPDVLV